MRLTLILIVILIKKKINIVKVNFTDCASDFINSDLT